MTTMRNRASLGVGGAALLVLLAVVGLQLYASGPDALLRARAAGDVSKIDAAAAQVRRVVHGAPGGLCAVRGDWVARASSPPHLGVTRASSPPPLALMPRHAAGGEAEDRGAGGVGPSTHQGPEEAAAQVQPALPPISPATPSRPPRARPWKQCRLGLRV